MKYADYIYRLAIWICVIVNFANGSVQSKVRCSKDSMEVDIVRSSPAARIYLERLKDYPDGACKPELNDGIATFRLSLIEEGMLRCGLTRVINVLTGQKVYYHRIIVEEPTDFSKHKFTVKCVINEMTVPKIQQQTLNERDTNSTSSSSFTSSSSSSSLLNKSLIKRRSLPDNFTEAELINGIEERNGNAPVPILNVGVRQGGNLVTGELNVSPGTPLQMEIYLDPISAPIYGILVTYMQVADTKTQEETIIFNGCSVDPYLFENFNTIDGDFLNAKFRAFKFPESTYVQFRGTVNVCVDKCDGIECSNGQFGYGRKKRTISSSTNEKNNLFEVTMSTFIKVDFEDGAAMDEALLEFVRRGKNNSEDMPVIAKEVREQFKYRVIEETLLETSGSSNNNNNNNTIIKSLSSIVLIMIIMQLLLSPIV